MERPREQQAVLQQLKRTPSHISISPSKHKASTSLKRLFELASPFSLRCSRNTPGEKVALCSYRLQAGSEEAGRSYLPRDSPRAETGAKLSEKGKPGAMLVSGSLPFFATHWSPDSSSGVVWIATFSYDTAEGRSSAPPTAEQPPGPSNREH